MYGSGVGMASMGVMRPELVMKSIVPVVMAGVLHIYGFDHSCDTGINPKASLTIYLMAMPISLQSECTTTKALCGMILILIFTEALSLYGLIVGIILSSRAAVEGEHFTAKGIGMENMAGPEGGQAVALRTHL
uniref:Pectinesterase n=1 Tax=Brassica oleracea var. oleracea TaxID=109376 RepID=A0A0D3AA78_BRAOL